MNKNSEFESTKVQNRGGVTRSSVDGTVMVAGAKGLRQVWQNLDQLLFAGGI